ncbi:hypothetical protein E3N88_42552 [Mikania micrantha]|uniref:Uncharacterized protein n=1 Tax=Mikania micrantha TaxID=192012 RepID=A0A5N6LJN9_9ASTR|nr:hypothetical protein E3N88_42552 [Mikania micrantha]
MNKKLMLDLNDLNKELMLDLNKGVAQGRSSGGPDLVRRRSEQRRSQTEGAATAAAAALKGRHGTNDRERR